MVAVVAFCMTFGARHSSGQEAVSLKQEQRYRQQRPQDAFPNPKQQPQQQQQQQQSQQQLPTQQKVLGGQQPQLQRNAYGHASDWERTASSRSLTRAPSLIPGSAAQVYAGAAPSCSSL